MTVQIRGTIRTTPRIIPKRQKTAALQKLAHFLRRFPNSQSFSEINWGFLRLNKRILDCAGKAQLPWRFFHGGVTSRALSASWFAKSREAERRKAVSRCACHRSPKKCRYCLTLVYSSFGFHHSFVLRHSCFVIYRQEILKFSKDDRDPLVGLRSKTSLNTHRSPDLCSLTFILPCLLR